MSPSNETPWFAGGQQSGLTQSQKTTAHVTAPPAEISVRTMASDLASLTQSGGGRPAGEPVVVAHAYRPSKPSAEKSGGILGNFGVVIKILELIGIIAMFAGMIVGGYYLYSIFGKSKFEQKPVSRVTPLSSQTSTSPSAVSANLQPPIAPEEAQFDHHSFFQKSPDATLPLILGGAAIVAADLQGYGQKMMTLSRGVPSGATLVEIVIKKPNGYGIPFWDFLEAMHLSFLDNNFLADRIEPDFTFFVYREKAGVWPGFLLKPIRGQDVMSVKEDMVGLESNSDISSFFLEANMGRRVGIFQNDAVGDYPVRLVKFENKGVFVYGVVKEYLLFSTSKEGFAKAAQSL